MKQPERILPFSLERRSAYKWVIYDANDKPVGEIIEQFDAEYLQEVANAYPRLMGERDKLVAENERLLESQETLWKALKDLHKTASVVSRYGARTGPQWVQMSGSLAIARIALTSLEKDNG